MTIHLPVSEMIRILIDRAYSQGEKPNSIRLATYDAEKLQTEMFEFLHKKEVPSIRGGEYFAGILIESVGKVTRTCLITTPIVTTSKD